MEDFVYVDLFSTKGPEYIAVIVFLISFAAFLKYLNTPAVALQKIPVAAKLKIALVDWFNQAEDYFYHKGHTWVNSENGNVVTVGMDDFAQRLIGVADEIRLPEPGSKLNQGENAFRILKDNKLFNILSPVNGEVTEINKNILAEPSLVNQQPYQDGWLFKVKMGRPEKDFVNLLSGKTARGWIEDTIQKLNTKITGELGLVLQDGGEPVVGFAKEIAGDDWETLINDFLLSGSNE